MLHLSFIDLTIRFRGCNHNSIGTGQRSEFVAAGRELSSPSRNRCRTPRSAFPNSSGKNESGGKRAPLHGHSTPPTGTVLTPGKPLEPLTFDGSGLCLAEVRQLQDFRIHRGHRRPYGLESEHLLRAAHRGVRQMPPLASNIADPRAIEVLQQWIAELDVQKKK